MPSIAASPAPRLDLIDVLVALGAKYHDAYLPGYTHLQRAQPVLLSHHLNAHAWSLLRDVDRLLDARRTGMSVSPLGAGALAGTSLPIDPQYVAGLLGFDAAFTNSLDAVSDRDFVAETLFAIALLGVHLSRMGEELVLWTSTEFNFAVMSDEYATGSSMLPQKKNSDVAELARAKSGRLVGNLTGLLVTLKGLPLSYNRDLQEDKEPLFDSVRQVLLVLAGLRGVYDTLTFNEEVAARAADDPFMVAIDIAEELVSEGVPFRQAHEQVGQLVAEAVKSGRHCATSSPTEPGVRTLRRPRTVRARRRAVASAVAGIVENAERRGATRALDRSADAGGRTFGGGPRSGARRRCRTVRVDEGLAIHRDPKLGHNTLVVSRFMTLNTEPANKAQTMGASDSYAIWTDGLVRSFGDVRAVNGVNIQIPKGEIYGFLGPNGAGKSTTVHMLCTLLAPSGGRATVAGFDVQSDPGKVRLHIGVALQDVALDAKQTGAELLSLQGRLYGLSRREIQRRVSELAELIDLGDFLDRMIGTYSGGMKRRLDLAAALIHNPEVIFLDEPTTGLDPVSRLQVWAEVRRLNAELGITIFLTTQYLEEADELAHRVGIIDQGQIVAEGTPEDLKRAVGSDLILVRVEGDATEAIAVLGNVPGVQKVEAHGIEIVITTSSGSATISPVAVALAGTDIVVRDLLRFVRPTLDDTSSSSSPVPTSVTVRRNSHDHQRCTSSVK